MNDGKLITHVYHDEDDHGWQFHSDDESSMKYAMLVALKEVVELDASILEVADLQPGWMARRTATDPSWTRQPNPSQSTVVTVNWAEISTKEAFYDTVLAQCGSPEWHGRNLDALADSWITGGIDSEGPPYRFEFIGGKDVSDEMVEFRDAVHEIAEKSVEENGGQFNEAEQKPGSDPDKPGGSGWPLCAGRVRQLIGDALERRSFLRQSP
jgi:RNAse (barnase) inhibitor barstar